MIVQKKKADCKQKRRGWHINSFVRADRVGDASPSFSLPSAASSSERRYEDQEVDKQQQQQQQKQKQQQQQQHSKENNKKESEEGIPDKKDVRVDNKGAQMDQMEKSDQSSKESSRGKDDQKPTEGKNCSVKTKSDEDRPASSQKDDKEGKCENHCEEPQSENMWRVTAASTEVEGTKVDGKAKISKEEEEEQLKNPMRLELKDVGVGVDEEEKMSARARKIYLMKELFGDDSVIDEVRRDISARLSSFHLSLFPSQLSCFISFPSKSFFSQNQS